MRIFVLIVAVGVVLACSPFQDGGSFGESGEPGPYDGETSLEERIASYPTVVRATLDRVTSEVVAAGGYGTGSYVIVVKFHLTVLEYLNGTGATSITAVWGSFNLHDTRGSAEAARPSVVAQRDTSFDDRQAVFFLTSDFWELFATLKAENTYYLSDAEDFVNDDFMSLSSRHNRLWLPTADGTTGTGDSQEFLLALPEPSPPQATPNAPTITLGALRAKIASVIAELNGGDGSEAYKECIRRRYKADRQTLHAKSEGRERSLRAGAGVTTHRVASGGPAGTVIYDIDLLGHYPDEKFFTTWLEGGDAALFAMVDGPTTPKEKNYDGVLTAGEDWISYTQSLKSLRPLPGGEYTFNIRDRTLRPTLSLCIDASTHEWTVTANAPEGVLHEAFFDPVTVGTTVSADDTNGQLEPASFTGANGSSATLETISWEAGAGDSGTVKIEVTPDYALAGHFLDFIELDGSVSLSLDVADATDDAPNNTLSWSVATQPWEDGDLLMVRIREAK